LIAILNENHGCPAKGRLLLVEMLVPPGNDPSFSKLLLDLLMLV
jgi:hypothetical protein